jgi:hypothetical protein
VTTSFPVSGYFTNMFIPLLQAITCSLSAVIRRWVPFLADAYNNGDGEIPTQEQCADDLATHYMTT